ncbi:unnamed protein product [Lactuca saligna]|uniref:Uncharacterized protein n=1 Tax=Lactuca saligna TaxID=75948 RepID=A0AA35ZNL2_LACSI|nr:unnamed protein product [Lactuca saligna]
MASTYWASLKNRICSRECGGSKGSSPYGYGSTALEAAIEQFLTEQHQKRSARNKECRKKQVVKNRGGTCSYGSACFKKDVDVNDFLQNPAFVTAIGDIFRSFKNQVNEENNDGEDGGEDEDN